jgi:Methyltransferase domain
LQIIKAYTEELARINVHEPDNSQPGWVNGFLPGLDGAAIYGLLRDCDPAQYFEIGSGNSTRFAARAKTDGDLRMTITSIDPQPRAEINALCDEIIRQPLESQDLSVWKRVGPGDVVFMDGSHRVFMNGDVVAFFLDVLPRLPAGVLVGIHDIYLPYDYPVDIADRYYSEQYILAAWLLGGAPTDIVLPAYWVTQRMQNAVADLWASSPRFAAIEHHGVAFWLRTV